MKKFGMLAVASLLWASSAFAAENKPSLPGKVTVAIGGKTVATLWLNDFPSFGEWKMNFADGVKYDSEKGIATASGKGIIEIKDENGEKELLHMAFDDATVEIDYNAVPDKK